MTSKKHISPAKNNKNIPACDPFNIDDVLCSWSQEELEEEEAKTEAYEREERRTTEKLVQNLAGCFEEIEKHFGPREAKICFEGFLKSPWIKQRLMQDRHYHSKKEKRNQKYVADYDAAPKGEKESVIQSFADENDMTYVTAKNALTRARKKDVGCLFRKWVEKL